LEKTNHLLKSLRQKGFFKKKFASKNNRLGKAKYLLTKKGMKEKLKLTYYFFNTTFNIGVQRLH